MELNGFSSKCCLNSTWTNDPVRLESGTDAARDNALTGAITKRYQCKHIEKGLTNEQISHKVLIRK